MNLLIIRHYLEYLFVRLLILKTYFIPFRALYFFSDIFAFVIRDIIRYRRKTVRQNIQLAFPEKTEKERKKIENGFYRAFSDVLLETLKSYTLSHDTFHKRMFFENPEILDPYYEQRKSCIFLLAHYGNWEWVTHIIPYLKHHSCVLYKPLHNKFVNDYVYKRRQKLQMSLYSIEQTGLMVRRHIHQPAIFAYISDQNPPFEPEEPYWVQFFNRPTAALGGAETLARKFNLPVFYVWLKPVRRGFYTLKLEPLSLKPQDTAPGEITQLYMSKLEEQIRGTPEYWLWSHRRWKRKIPDYLAHKFRH